MNEYVVDLSRVASFSDAIAAFNAGLIESGGGHWNGNLDAFNDYLSWPAEGRYRLVLRGADQGRRALGHAAMAQWPREHLGSDADGVRGIRHLALRAEH